MVPWIKSQVKRLLGRSENVYYKKLKRILKHQDIINQYTHIYFLGAFEYNDENYDKYKELETAALIKFLSATKYNAQRDNVEIFLIKNTHSQSTYLLTLLDPVELYSPEQILDITISPDLDLVDLNYEQIFPDSKDSRG